MARFSVSCLTLVCALAACRTTVAIQVPEYPAETSDQLRALLGGERTLGLTAGDNADQESKLIAAAVEQEINRMGFYTMVNMDTRDARLGEMERGGGRPGLEMPVHLLLVVTAPQPGQFECKVEDRIDFVQVILGLNEERYRTDAAARIQLLDDARRPTAVMYYTVFARANLVNVETGRSLSAYHAEPYEYAARPGVTNCPDEATASGPALRMAAQNLARQLSPAIRSIDVPLVDDVADLPDDTQSEVQALLQKGNGFAARQDFQRAVELWREALDLANDASRAAYWNLAVYHWQAGDVVQARRSFEAASTDARWMDSRMRKAYARFLDTIESGWPGEEKRID